MKFTTVSNKTAPFAFNFPDLAGKPVSNADARSWHSGRRDIERKTAFEHEVEALLGQY